jgi:hypothetical protein
MDNSDTSVPLIRTGLRETLPRGLSHAIGTELISHALRGCPRYDELWIAFGSGPESLDPVPAECSEFHHAFAVVCNNCPGTWYLSVPAVTSAERAVARRLLITVGLPRARDWLCRPRPETWYEGFRLFQAGFTIAPQRMCFVESLNHRVLDFSTVSVEGAPAAPRPKSN